MTQAPHRRGRNGPLLATLAAALALFALWWDVRRPEPPVGRRPANEAPPPAPTAPSLRPAGSAEPTYVPGPPSRWRVKARGAIDREIARAGLDAEVSESEREELLAALVRQRRASRAAQRLRPDHPRQAEYGRAIVESDRRFREILGVGIGQFALALGRPGQIEDLSAARQ